MCGIDTRGTAHCWGEPTVDAGRDSRSYNKDFGQHLVPADVKHKLVFITSGWSTTCGLEASGAATCFGDNKYGQTDVPQGPDGSAIAFSGISTGGWHTCGVVQGSGFVKCWGLSNYGSASPPSGVAFKQVTTGSGYITCGLELDGKARCWGSEQCIAGAAKCHQNKPPTDTTFTEISCGGDHCCGVQPSGLARCWGSNEDGKSNVPAGVQFRSISAGAGHTCAVELLSGLPNCFGWLVGHERAPAGVRFRSIGAGRGYSCGMSVDGTPRCAGWPT